ncbi:hypothetical protein A1O3_06677 [Capronia epimyces CBS 606.96]|uniref:Cytochrome P450 oxidoreductase n=1 Tax=Capronia epimyces CBS 606.96 TaxID=1182542 RepID=W9XQR7_9EURO|nr:uncharacterized protein A1O3_06677 [Capronia epimyces CBS 606.96]EXJ82862.1 hypothetical protein A1O3_06677 [Capronia epimyces CBS 606.96]
MADLPAVFSIANIAFLTVFYYLARSVYRLFLHPLSKAPGPWYLAISTIPGTYYICISGRYNQLNRRLHEHYGPIVRVGPNKLSVRGEIGWQAIYGHKPREAEEWSKWPAFFVNIPPDITTAPTAEHRRLRREIIRAFSDKAIQEQQSIFHHYANLLIQRWRERDQTVIDLAKWFNFFTFDTFGDLAFGEPFGSLQGGESHPWVNLIFDSIKINKMSGFLEEFPLIKRLAILLTPPDLKRRATEHFELSEQKIRQRLTRDRGDRKDFVSYIWKSDGTGLTQQELERNASTLIVAGSETTATTLSALISYLLRNPDKYDRIAHEIRSTYKGGDEEVTLLDAANVPYVHACIEETLRLFPAVPIGAPRQVGASGGFIEQYRLPPKTLLEVPQWATHRASVNFRDPDDFIPERWLPASHAWYDEKYANDNRGVVQSFSYGPRACLGRTLAYHEMRFILSLILKNFDFEPTPEGANWVERCEHYFFWVKPPLPVKLRGLK